MKERWRIERHWVATMEGDAASFRAKVLKALEEEGIGDADVREDTQGECPTVAAYVEKLVSEYWGGKKDE